MITPDRIADYTGQPKDSVGVRMAALQLTHWVNRYNAMQWTRARLLDRPRVGLDVFTRFQPWERGELSIERKRVWRLSWFDFCSARGRVARRSELSLGTNRR